MALKMVLEGTFAFGSLRLVMFVGRWLTKLSFVADDFVVLLEPNQSSCGAVHSSIEHARLEVCLLLMGQFGVPIIKKFWSTACQDPMT